MAISSGNYTVGSGGDYSTWAAAVADVTNLTGNLTLTQISALTDTTAWTISVDLAGFMLRLASNNPHLGNFQGGWLTNLSMNLSSASAYTLSPTSSVAGATMEVDGLVLKPTGTLTGFGILIKNSSSTLNVTHKVSNSLFNGNAKGVFGIRSANASCIINYYNCISINGTTGFYLENLHSSSVIENCVAYGNTSSGIYNVLNSVFTVRNCIAMQSPNCFRTLTVGGLGNALAYKCASSDTTGSEASLQGLSAANEFVNVSPLTLGFLQLKPTSILNFMGVAPTIAGNTTGIRGNARPLQANVYSIGADEQGSTISSLKYTVGTGGDYSTWAAFAAALPASFVQDITGEQISDITDSAAITIDKALNGCALTLDNRQPHAGSFVRGYKTTFSMNLSSSGALTFICSSTVAGARIFIKNLNCIYTGTITTYGLGITVKSATANIINVVRDCLFDANARAMNSFRTEDASCIAHILNCVAANGYAPTGAYSAGFNILDTSSGTIIENCTSYAHTQQGTVSVRSAGILNFANRTFGVTNFASFGNYVDYVYGSWATLGLGNAFVYKGASSDTSGSEVALRSLITADQFVSLDITNADFLKLKTGSALLNSGVTPFLLAYNNKAIRGNDRLHGACYSIGADAWTDTNAGISTVGTGGDYTTWNAFFSALGTLTKNVKGVQISDIALVSTASYTGAKAGYNMELTSNVDPRGNFNDGWVTTIGFVGTVHGVNLGGTSTIPFSKNIVTNLRLRRTVGYSSGQNVYAMLIFTSPLSNNINIAKGVLLDGNNLRGSGMGVSGAVTYYSNCKAANMVKDATVTNNGYGFGISVTTGAGSIIENCSAYNCRLGFWNYSNLAVTYRNLVAFNCALDYANGTGAEGGAGSNTTMSKCASSDTYGSEASLRSLVPNDHFKSLDISSANFLRVKKTSILASGGTYSLFPTIVNYPASLLNTRGVNGSRRPHMV